MSWDEVPKYAHVDSVLNPKPVSDTAVPMSSRQSARTVSDEWIGTDEVDRILAETYFPTAMAIMREESCLKKVVRPAWAVCSLKAVSFF